MKKEPYFFHLKAAKICILVTFALGEMAERSNAAVLKTVDCYRSGGSNPSLSANALKPRQGAFLFSNESVPRH